MTGRERIGRTVAVIGILGLVAWTAAERPSAQALVIDTELPSPSIDEYGIHAPVGYVVRYTVDGSEPDQRSDLYQGALPGRPAMAIERILATPTSPQWRHPQGPLPEAWVIRARVFDERGRSGPVATRTFFTGGAPPLPIVSLALAPSAFFDPDSGIYVPGHAIFHDDEDFVRRFPQDQRWWRYPGNYHFRGGHWEREGCFELIATGARWTSPVAMRINGNNTRGFPQHALRLSFPKKSEGRRHFGRVELVLRAGGNDQDRAFLRDAVQHELCATLPFGTSSYQPCVVYVNGAYWGLHDLRTRMDAEGIARANGIGGGRITVAEDRGVLVAGDSTLIRTLKRALARCEQWDPAAAWYADSLDRYFDMEGFLTYMAAQIILGNSDWPDQNVRYWRVTKVKGEAKGVNDGRWRFVMGDSDMGLGFNGGSGVDLFAHVAANTGPVARLYRAAMRNAALRGRFRHITLSLLENELSTARLTAALTAARDRIAPVMPDHIRRWRRPSTLQRWNEEVDLLLTFAQQRREVVARQLDHHLPEIPEP